MPTVIQVRRDTAAGWTSAGTTLAAGEIGYETDTGNFKVGDGTNGWTALAYQMPYINTGSLTNGKTSTVKETLVVNHETDRVGIGTATPAQKLDVVGTAAISGATTIGSTLAVTGDTTLTGDLAVNGGDITTTSTGTATVFNTNATTLNVGQAATTVSIGSTSGTATIRNATTAITNAATVGGTLAVTGNTTLSGDLAVNGATSADITTTTTTATVFNTTATTLNVGQAATAVSIGANASGTTTIRNATTAITGAATVGGTLSVTGTTAFTGAPSYAADPTTDNILSRKSYVDSRLRIGGVVIITCTTNADYPRNAGGTFTPGIADPGLDTAGIAGKPSTWTASITTGVLSIQTDGGTWFGCHLQANSDGQANIRYAYQTSTNVAQYAVGSRGCSVILVRTA
jgi:hypothetical protein